MDHPSGADHIGIRMKLINPVKSHGNVTGDIDPQRDVVLLAGRRIRGGEFLQNLLRADRPEEIRLRDLACSFEEIKLAPLKGFDDEPVIALK
jgi:hypothetical protein